MLYFNVEKTMLTHGRKNAILIGETRRTGKVFLPIESDVEKMAKTMDDMIVCFDEYKRPYIKRSLKRSEEVYLILSWKRGLIYVPKKQKVRIMARAGEYVDGCHYETLVLRAHNGDAFRLVRSFGGHQCWREIFHIVQDDKVYDVSASGVETLYKERGCRCPFSLSFGGKAMADPTEWWAL